MIWIIKNIQIKKIKLTKYMKKINNSFNRKLNK